MTTHMLQPENQMIEWTGKMAYQEGAGAWNTVRLKRVFVEQFPMLRDKQSKFQYKMVYHRDYATLLEFLNKLKEEKVGAPLLLFVYQE